MALQKPYNISLFGKTIDGDENNTITWSVSGDIQVAYQVEIKNNSTDVLVYDSTKTTSFNNSHLLPSSSLANGVEYKINITIWNTVDDSIISDPVVFSAYSKPTIEFDSFGTIGGSNYNFTATYTQDESVPLKNWQMFLYDNNDVLLNQSPLSTSTTIEYLFGGFTDGNTYKVECIATSNNDLIGTTGKVSFSVSYSQPETDFKPQIEVSETDASVKLSWYVIKILGTNVNGTFLDNSELDVTGDGEYFYFDTLFDVARDFTLKLWIRDIAIRKELLRISNGTQYIYLEYFHNKFHLYKVDGTEVSYHIESEEVVGTDFFVWIQHIDGQYNLISEVV